MRNMSNRLAKLERANPGCPACRHTLLLQDGDPGPPPCELCGGPAAARIVRIKEEVVGGDGEEADAASRPRRPPQGRATRGGEGQPRGLPHAAGEPTGPGAC